MMALHQDTQTRTIVGLEIHVQLATNTKLFCGCALEFGAEPNSRTCPVCLGLPGALPVINRRAVEFSVAVGLALGCKINPLTKWDRKSYYYPDLPKNYQISQYDLPIAYEGKFAIPTADGDMHEIRIRRAHLEEDAGKNLHDVPGCSLIDLNRAGTPLLEIVTEPDIASADEAYAFCTELQKLVTYLGVSEASMQKGQMRFEPNINVAIARDGREYRTPITEVKNLNSFRAVRDAIEYESQRQVQDWLADSDYVFGKSANENRGWNADKQVTEFQRGKEAAHDYRYFPEPDLPPLQCDERFVRPIQERMPELPLARRRRWVTEYEISEPDADAIVADPADADLFEAGAASSSKYAKRMVTFMLGVGKKVANEKEIPVSRLLPDADCWRQLVKLTEEGTISASAASTLLEDTLRSEQDAVDFEAIAKQRNLIQVRDESQTSAWVDQAFSENAPAVRDAVGNPKKAKAAAGFLTGKVMQISGGKADAKLVNQLVRKKLEELTT